VTGIVAAAMFVVLGALDSDRREPIHVGGNQTAAPGALDVRDYGRSVVAQGKDLGHGWTLSDQDVDPQTDHTCITIDGENNCIGLEKLNTHFVGCFEGGAYLIAASTAGVDRTWVEIEGSESIEGRWMPLLSPEGEGRMWLLFLRGRGEGTLHIGHSFEQATSWAPCHN
jgi:hypothetical protein